MAASLFRNTKTQNKTKALKKMKPEEDFLSRAIRGKLRALQWTEAECYSGVQSTITAELSTFSKWEGSNVEKRQTLGWLTVLNVRNEPERYEHCTQMKTQTLPDTGVRIKTIHLFKQTHGMRHRGSCFGHPHGTHMQEGAGRVRHHDGRERPEFESALKNICEMRASACMRASVWMSHYHAVHNDNKKQEQLPPSSNRCKHCHSQVFRKRDIGRFHDVTTSTIDRGNSIFSGLDTAISLQNNRLKEKFTKRF